MFFVKNVKRLKDNGVMENLEETIKERHFSQRVKWKSADHKNVKTGEDGTRRLFTG